MPVCAVLFQVNCAGHFSAVSSDSTAGCVYSSARGHGGARTLQDQLQDQLPDQPLVAGACVVWSYVRRVARVCRQVLVMDTATSLSAACSRAGTCLSDRKSPRPGSRYTSSVYACHPTLMSSSLAQFYIVWMKPAGTPYCLRIDIKPVNARQTGPGTQWKTRQAVQGGESEWRVKMARAGAGRGIDREGAIDLD